MRTQSIDTHPDAERVLIALLRQKGVSKRFQLTASMSRSIMVAAQLARQQQQPGLTEQEALFSSLERSLGQVLTAELRQVAERRQIFPAFATVELQAALFPVVQALEQMNRACALTGSLARSLYGMQRTLSQVDVLADLDNVDAAFLYELLPAAFFVRLADIQFALTERTSFLYYHLPSLFPIRVAFPQKQLGEPVMLARAHRLILVEGESALPVLTPEDMSLLTLVEVQQQEAELARRGRKEQADDLWNELLGVLKVQGPDLDLQRIEQQALPLGLLASAARAFEDAGLRE